jgi:hypothetical protein
MKTLGIDEEDSVDMVHDLEASFGVRFSKEELAEIRTVGDIHRILKKRISERPTHGDRCATAMAFYRLRRYLVDQGFNGKLVPATPVDRLSTRTVKTLVKQLSKMTGLRLPQGDLAALGTTGAVAVVLGFLALLIVPAVAPHWWPAALLSIVSGMLLVRLDTNKFPRDCRTVGDLAQKVAGLNFGKFVEEGAGYHDKALWSALVEVLSNWSTFPKREIGPAIWLLRDQGRLA